MRRCPGRASFVRRQNNGFVRRLACPCGLHAGRQRVNQKNLVIAENYGLSKISLSALCDFAESTWTCWHWIYKLKIINNSNQAVINLRSVSMNLDTIS